MPVKPQEDQQTNQTNQTPTLWFATDGKPFQGNEPFFFNNEDFPWVRIFEENYPAIKAEVEALLARKSERLKAYHVEQLVFPPQSWKTLGFQFWNFKLHGNLRYCPTIARVIDSVPGCIAGVISHIEPQSEIRPHHGDTNAIIRIHLGLDVPEGLPNCGFQVGNEVREWEEGRVLLFCDAQRHTAFNRSDRSRTIMIFDVIRPEFAKQKTYVCSRMVGKSLVQLFTKGKDNRRMESVLTVVAWVLLPLQRTLGKYFVR